MSSEKLDIVQFIGDYLNLVVDGNTEGKIELLKKGENEQLTYSDLALSIHQLVSTINPQIDFIDKLQATKFDVLIHILKDNGTLKEQDLSKLEELLSSLDKNIDEQMEEN
ncbi:hypothetical protein KQUDLBSD_CDS0115 [Staphylococcus phage PG-2021_40]|nr:hypothetical protein [Mammaliicoccus phage vB_MscM-PMS3]WBF82195.1 hypothetical protein [Mammaliicoccus virus vB_MscM-PMS2]